MSGAHRIQKPRRRLVLAVRLPGRYALASIASLRMHMSAARDWCSRHLDDVLDWINERFTHRAEDFWAEPTASETSPDPLPVQAPAAPAPVAVPEPEPLHLTPEQALRTLHEQRRDLPGHLLQWRTTDTTVHGAVSSLDCNPDEQREIVEFYAGVLHAGITEHSTEDGHVTVSTTASFAGATIVVSAVLLNGDTIPLRVYDEAAGDETLDDTLTTQLIPPSVLEQVMS